MKKQKKGFKKIYRKKRYVRAYIERNYFWSDKIFIHAIEKGQERESTILYYFKKCDKLK